MFHRAVLQGQMFIKAKQFTNKNKTNRRTQSQKNKSIHRSTDKLRAKKEKVFNITQTQFLVRRGKTVNKKDPDNPNYFFENFCPALSNGVAYKKWLYLDYPSK